MGLISILRSSLSRVKRGKANASTATVDQGGGNQLTPDHYSSPGDDSNPLPGDYALLAQTPRTGSTAAVGYIDPANAGVTAPGEKRIYARNASGETVVALHLLADGSAKLANALGHVALLADGTVNINGVTIDVLGNVVATSLEAGTITIGGVPVATVSDIPVVPPPTPPPPEPATTEAYAISLGLGAFDDYQVSDGAGGFETYEVTI